MVGTGAGGGEEELDDVVAGGCGCGCGDSDDGDGEGDDADGGEGELGVVFGDGEGTEDGGLGDCPSEVSGPLVWAPEPREESDMLEARRFNS